MWNVKTPNFNERGLFEHWIGTVVLEFVDLLAGCACCHLPCGEILAQSIANQGVISFPKVHTFERETVNTKETWHTYLAQVVVR